MIDRKHAIRVATKVAICWWEHPQEIVAEKIVDEVLALDPQPIAMAEDPARKAAIELVQVIDAPDPPIAKPETPRLRALAALRDALAQSAPPSLTADESQVLYKFLMYIPLAGPDDSEDEWRRQMGFLESARGKLKRLS